MATVKWTVQRDVTFTIVTVIKKQTGLLLWVQHELKVKSCDRNLLIALDLFKQAGGGG